MRMSNVEAKEGTNAFAPRLSRSQWQRQVGHGRRRSGGKYESGHEAKLVAAARPGGIIACLQGHGSDHTLWLQRRCSCLFL